MSEIEEKRIGKKREMGDSNLRDSLVTLPLVGTSEEVRDNPLEEGDTLLDRELGSISRSLDALNGSCELLEKRCNTLNWALEDANSKLRDSLEERERLASRLDGILQCLSAGVIAVDLDGKLIEFNPAAEKITGYARAEVLGTHYSSLAGRAMSERLGPVHAMRCGAGVENEEKSIHTSAGDRIPVSYSTSLVHDDRGELLGAVEVFSDLRKSKAIEEELLRTRTVAAIGEMATDVARQIRNPLAGLSGFAELLERDLQSDPGRSELVSRIRQGVSAVEGAVVRLLENSAPVIVEFRPADVVALTEKVLDLFESAMDRKRRIPVNRHMCVNTAVARINEEQIGQALRSILLNAWEATADGGAIEVSVAIESPSLVERAMEENGENPPSLFVVLTIADSGRGMSLDVAANAFSPFFSTSEKQMGLGLTAARRIVTGHGGEIDLTSTESGGTVVVIRLPGVE